MHTYIHTCPYTYDALSNTSTHTIHTYTKKTKKGPGMVTQIFNLNTWEAEADGCL